MKSLALVGTLTLFFAVSTYALEAADNTGRNAEDRGREGLTAGDQSNSPDDMGLTQKIRQAVVADDSLSTMAHNVKIITTSGVVTLRGPVKTPEEKAKIGAKAAQIAGANRVTNDLEIAPQ